MVKIMVKIMAKKSLLSRLALVEFEGCGFFIIPFGHDGSRQKGREGEPKERQHLQEREFFVVGGGN